MEIKIESNSIFVDGVEYIKKEKPKPRQDGLTIFWNHNKHTAIIGKYLAPSSAYGGSYLSHNRQVFMNAIPFESIEQYEEFIKK